jgi:dolichyl-diphosphooligosaccharide--protein glycosyltransferase
MFAINNYGRVIHEFDPWFNMRATQYLADNGAEKFFKWYDHESWYPLGRPVGTTIYPGMQFTAVYIWKILNMPVWAEKFGLDIAMSLNDVCVFIPVWFGALATVVTGALTREVYGSWRAGAMGALVMSIVPAHLMRSVGGGFDNESVAMFAMVLSFYLWCRSLRTSSSWWIGVPAGLAYGYMVSSWGGFIFVCNMIGLHAAVLVGLGYFSSTLHKAYSLWYLVGTACALQIPVVGWSPLQSMEQMGPLLVFLGMQFMFVTNYLAAKRGLTWSDDWRGMLRFRAQSAGVVGGVAVAIIAVVIPTGYFGPLSIRVRSLFIPHTRTGNPLVDSVAEHQPATPDAYQQFLHHTMQLIIPGVTLALFATLAERQRKYTGVQVNKWFVIVFTAVVQYFCNKMMRLLILMGPVAAVLSGIALSEILQWAFAQLGSMFDMMGAIADEAAAAKKEAKLKKEGGAAPAVAAAQTTPGKKTPVVDRKKEKEIQKAADENHVLSMYGPLKMFIPAWNDAAKLYNSSTGKVLRIGVAIFLTMWVSFAAREFYGHCFGYAEANSQPSIMFKATLNDGKNVIINDYQEAYWFLRDNTPTDARVLSWWGACCPYRFVCFIIV